MINLCAKAVPPCDHQRKVIAVTGFTKSTVCLDEHTQVLAPFNGAHKQEKFSLFQPREGTILIIFGHGGVGGALVIARMHRYHLILRLRESGDQLLANGLGYRKKQIGPLHRTADHHAIIDRVSPRQRLRMAEGGKIVNGHGGQHVLRHFARHGVVGVVHHVKIRDLPAIGGRIQVPQINKSRPSAGTRGGKVLPHHRSIRQGGKTFSQIFGVIADTCANACLQAVVDENFHMQISSKPQLCKLLKDFLPREMRRHVGVRLVAQHAAARLIKQQIRDLRGDGGILLGHQQRR